MDLIYLSYVFFKIGLFGFGGGYCMISLIQHEVVDNYGWMTSQSFADILAISQMTPGPISINTATATTFTCVCTVVQAMPLRPCANTQLSRSQA